MTQPHGVDEIKQGWQDDAVAQTYDEKRFSTLSGKLSDWLDKRAIGSALTGVPADAPLLDLPCGTGRILHHMYISGRHNLVGADISTQMLDVAKGKMNGRSSVEFAIADATKTGFPADAFQAITSIRFMGHLPAQTRQSVLREFWRICSGLVVVEYPQRSVAAGWVKRVLRVFTVQARLGQGQWSWNVLSAADLDAEFRAAGLTIVRKVRKLPLLSDSVFIVARRLPIGP